MWMDEDAPVKGRVSRPCPAALRDVCCPMSAVLGAESRPSNKYPSLDCA